MRHICLALSLGLVACTPVDDAELGGDPVDGKGDDPTSPFDPASCPGNTISVDRFDALTAAGTLPTRAEVFVRLDGKDSDPTQGQSAPARASVSYDVQPDQIDVDVIYTPAGHSDRYVWGAVLLPDNPWSILDWESGYHDLSAEDGDEKTMGGTSIVVNEHCLRTHGIVKDADGTMREIVTLARY